MGKGIEEWTDRDYAEAAIDMLPGTVEEIAEWMRVHKIKGIPDSSTRCPVAQWMSRWTGGMTSAGWQSGGALPRLEPIAFPKPVTDFILAVDRRDIQL